MNKPLIIKPIVFDEHRAAARRAGLEAAERSNVREGLPPRSDAARALGERYAKGELTADQAVAEVVQYHRSRSGQ